MGLTAAVEATLETAAEQWPSAPGQPSLRVVDSEPETRWCKLDHLLYLPVLTLERPRQLYWYQGEGLGALYGFTYKYLTLEHFLGQLTRLQVGEPLAQALAVAYTQAWYAALDALMLFADWHVKPHWTKHPSHCGSVTMWGRVMPGTKQLILNGPDGHLLGGWNFPIDAHFSGVLVELEQQICDLLHRPIAYSVVDSEAAGLPLAQRYAEAQRCYLTVLPRQGDQSRTAFELLSEWQPVVNDPDHEAAEARWSDPEREHQEVRRLVIMRPVGETEPTRVYTGCIPDEIAPGQVPERYRRRWSDQERVIRQLVNGANLNANYGYTHAQVPSRTQRRRWEEAQQSVEACQRLLAQHQEALVNLIRKLTRWRREFRREADQLRQEIAAWEQERDQRQQAGRCFRQVQGRIDQRQRRLEEITQRFQRRRRKLIQDIVHRRRQRQALQQALERRQATRDAIDTDQLVRERDLEKDQIMLNLQVLLLNLHDWARSHYFAPDWSRLELETALALIYRKSGRVRWSPDQIEVILDPYRYPEQQAAMEETCRRFNQRQPCWRDGRRLLIRVARSSDVQLCNCQRAGQT